MTAIQMPKEITVLEALDSHKTRLFIYRYSDDPIKHYVDCGHDRTGRKAYYELPRAAKSLRGAKQIAALLSGEKLTWSEPCA